ncbi:MAG: VTT domain-containing protein [Chloroflexota bacterium]|nr:VTT domain-containing protein [Chloroflexota bacterium]
MKNNFLLKLILFVAALFTLWISREPLASTWEWFSDREAVTASMDRTGIWSSLILFILFVLQVFLAFIPGQALMVACGYLYGFWGGFLLSWLSLVAGGEAAFVLARLYGRSFADKWIAPDVLARWDKAAEGQGIGFYTLALVLPLVPNDAMCYVAGLGKISHRRFSIANLLGRGMACVVTSWIGAFGAHATTYVWIILIVIAAGIAGWFIYKKAGSFPDAKKKLANACGMLIARIYRKMFSLRYEVKGLEALPAGAKIIAINHTNVTDAIFLPLVFSKVPRFIAQGDLFQIPVLGQILKGTGQIPVNAEDPSLAFEQACELLKRGETILIFPEGQLVPFGQSVRGKTGAARLSKVTGAPIIPLGIYTDPRDVTTLNIKRLGKKRCGMYQFRGTSHLRFGTPWKPDIQTNFHAQTDELMSRIYSLVAEAQKESQCVSHTSLNPIPQW